MRHLPAVLTKLVGSKGLALQSKSPTIFFVGGVLGIVTSTVLACRATLELEETLDEFIDDNVITDGVIDDSVTKIHRPVRAAVAVTKLYAPAVIVGGASIVMLTKSHTTLMKRNAALSAAYTALDKGFREYRGRVVEKYGQDEDDRLRYGFVTEKGKKIEGSKKAPMVDRVDPETGASIYARFFDQYNPNWSKDPELNKLFLRSQQNYLNDLLITRGHVFLNEVYRELGFDHSQAGAVVGWILGEGDNYIDLGVFTSHADEGVRDFVNGREGVVLLDFNVDGLIFNRIKEDKPDIKWQNSRWHRI